MPKIAISYRRDDSDAMTGRIFDRLVSHYDRETVFRDIDNIPLGVDFRAHIGSVLDQSDVVLVVVGPRWIGGRGGQSRLANPADPVRIEVETALRKGIPVIPILVGQTPMPKVDQLPESLADFAYRNGTRVDTGQDFDVHIDRLIRAMDMMFRAAKPTEPHPVESNLADVPAAVQTAENDKAPADPSPSIKAPSSIAPPGDVADPASPVQPPPAPPRDAGPAAVPEPRIEHSQRDQLVQPAPAEEMILGHLEFTFWARRQAAEEGIAKGKSDREIRQFLEDRGYRMRWSFVRGQYVVTAPGGRRH